VGSPVCDLTYCLCFDASKVVFDQRLDTYLRIYSLVMPKNCFPSGHSYNIGRAVPNSECFRFF
jgi:hypothetical protein